MIDSVLLKIKHIVLCLLALSIGAIETNQWRFSKDRDYSEIAEMSGNRNAFCDKMCIGKVLTKSLKAKQIKAEQIESETIKTDSMCAHAISSDIVCARAITASEKICTPFFGSPVICTEQLIATNICSNGLTKVNEFQQCGKYRATAVFSVDTPYILGTLVPWNTILDDPNGNIALAPFSYTAPISGYYMITAKINQRDIAGASTIIGTPIANLELLVNGSSFREIFSPYLSFHNEQKVVLSSLISLNAGDVVQAHYHVYVMDDVIGFSPYIGTIVIKGNGTEANNSLFKIHYLSSDCTDLPCTPCQSVCTPEPCDIPCVPVDCHNMDCCDKG